MRRRALAASAVLALLAAAEAPRALALWRARGRGAVQRGFDVALASGCFGCHGPGGLSGLDDPGADIGGIPTWGEDEVRAYAKTQAEVRQWILDGELKPAESEPEDAGPPPLFQMPAYRGVLSEREVDDLVAYVSARASLDAPREAAAAAGREAAERLGCFNCHGPQGRGALANPRSFKGHIPAWDGAEFADLVRDESELREWVLDGAPRRLREHPVARWFLKRQVIRMPPFRDRISEPELDAIVAYVRWLRTTSTARQGG